MKKSPSRLKCRLQRRTREGGYPYKSLFQLDKWIPAFAGMTLRSLPGACDFDFFKRSERGLRANGAAVSPTVLRKAGYRFFFFSREEARIHVHVHTANGEAKFWLEPEIELARNHRLTQLQLQDIRRIIEEHHDSLIAAWRQHFPRS